MLFQKDYVLRMIEMLGDFAHELLERLKDADAHLRLEEVCRAACGLSPSLLEKTDLDTLCDLLSDEQRYFAAHLLLLRGKLLLRKQGEEAQAIPAAQALRLFSSLSDPDEFRPAALAAAEILRPLLSHLPADALLCAAAALERGGEYALAEDAFYAAEAPKDILSAFYHRLLLLPQERLIAGGLPKEEIEEALE